MLWFQARGMRRKVGRGVEWARPVRKKDRFSDRRRREERVWKREVLIKTYDFRCCHQRGRVLFAERKTEGG